MGVEEFDGSVTRRSCWAEDDRAPGVAVLFRNKNGSGSRGKTQHFFFFFRWLAVRVSLKAGSTSLHPVRLFLMVNFINIYLYI